MNKKDFLIEIGTEELPPKNLLSLEQAFAENINKQLENFKLECGNIKTYATPRRLAVIVEQLATAAEDHIIEKRGPALSAAFDKDGKPTKACIGFAASCGVDVKSLKTVKNDKGDWLFYQQKQKGKNAKELLIDIVGSALNNLPIKRPMRWGAEKYSFVRPVHWVLMLFGNEVIKTEFFGIKTNKYTYGHRFHYPHAIAITDPKQYAAKLEKIGFVIADFNKRKENIVSQINKLVKNKGDAVLDDDLLNEVCAIVEWPVALLGSFFAKYLQIPKEVIALTLKQHQKCFTVVNKEKELLPYFITISNIQSKNPKQVIAGNERVISARLKDAEFFFQTDLKVKLDDRIEQLKQVVFQNKLGTLYDKTMRVTALAEYICNFFDAKSIKAAARAAILAKTDLLTNMVGEFPELQGVMGGYYAEFAQEPKAVVIAIKQQYRPSSAKDNVPEIPASCSLALADRIDTLVGIFGIDKKPTGEKDPFALRRAALGVLRIIIENKLDLDVETLLNKAFEQYVLPNKNTISQVLDFIFERLRAWYLDKGVTPQVFAAVFARLSTKPFDFHKRILAVQHFLTLPEAKVLAAANKRVSNILKQAIEIENVTINTKLFSVRAEHQLYQELIKIEKEVTPLFKQAEYDEALTKMAALREPIDQFFDHVMVMTSDENIRNNRLALLYKLRSIFLFVADISLL